MMSGVKNKNRVIYQKLRSDCFIILKPERYENYHLKKLEEFGFKVTLDKPIVEQQT